MPEREIMPRLPTSGQVIGALATRLGISHPVLQKRTTRRYFAADPERLVKDTSRAQIIGAIAEELTASGLITSSQTRDNNYELGPALVSMLQWHADDWDLFRSFIRRRTMSVLPSHLPKIWGVYVRLAVIDLALRVAAHLHLAGSSPAVLALLDSVSISSRGDYLNRKRQQAGISLEGLAEAVEVTNNSVDGWMYRGVRPSNDNLARIAETLASRIEGSTAANISLELRSLYWISDVAALLSEHIGVEAVAEAIGRLRRYAEETHRTIEDRFTGEDRAADLAVLADLGVGARIAEPLLSALIEQERDDEWREDLRATGIDRIRRVLSINLRVHSDDVDAQLQRNEGRPLEDQDAINSEAHAHYRRSLDLEVRGESDEALAEAERAARLEPLAPAYQFRLGWLKTRSCIWGEETALVDEGLGALWLAVTLDPTWIAPWTEIGATLHHTGRSAEAVVHLRNVKPECGPLDAHYHSTLGAACWKAGDLPRALVAFEASLVLDPEETSALLAASEIALLIGDDEKHRRYLRLARHFGADEGTLEFWELLREFGWEPQENADTAEYDRKIAVMDSVIRLNPADGHAHLTRGLAHFARGDDDMAMSDIDVVLEQDPDNATAYMLRGILFGNRKQWDRMVADMSELIRLRPDDALAHYHRGQAYGEQDALDQALADLCEAVRLDPGLADAYRVRGDCLRYKEEYDGAIGDFDTALRLDPGNAAAHLGRGGAYRMKGDLDQAIADYDAAVLLKPAEPLGYRFRADAHVAKGEYDLVIADCGRVLKLSPHDPIAHFTRGNAHLFNGNLELALADFNAAVESDPTSGRSTYGRGLVRLLMGDDGGAEEDFQLARDLGYEDQDPDC